MSVRRRLFPYALLVCAAAVATGCASGGKQVAEVPDEAPLVVTVAAPPSITAQKDGQGSYRFEMQQGETRMTADQFDAWMKANGIRVARGTDAPGAAPAASTSRD
jgi:hypothetical protein